MSKHVSSSPFKSTVSGASRSSRFCSSFAKAASSWLAAYSLSSFASESADGPGGLWYAERYKGSWYKAQVDVHTVSDVGGLGTRELANNAFAVTRAWQTLGTQV